MTIAAEAFFNGATLIEGRLFTEFFKHLPGVFTGIGIIGTFMGLITGLRAFQISEEPSVIRESLNLLLHCVHEAFLVSAGAIALAMIVTVLEKFLLAALHRQIEGLSQRLDSPFEAGAGEEYLARLVRATEDSSSQAQVLEDALVSDLKDLLSELTDRQITAAKSGNVELAERITSSLESGLKAPLDEVAKAVTAVGQQQGEAVNELLTIVLVSFSQRLEDLFGGQIAGINQLQQKTIHSLEAATMRLEQMLGNIEETSRSSSDALTDKLGEAISAIELRQHAMNEQMTEFVRQIHALVGESQNETGEKLQTTLGALGERFEIIVGALQKHADYAAGAHAERESRIARKPRTSFPGSAVKSMLCWCTCRTVFTGAVIRTCTMPSGVGRS